MRRSNTVTSLALFLLAVSACTELAGLGGKTFADAPALGGSGGSAPETNAGSPGGGAAMMSAGASGRVEPGTPGPSSGEGGSGAGRGGAADGGAGGDAERPCVDLTAELCLRTLWPNAVVPVAMMDAEWPPLVRSRVRDALGAWEGMLVGSTRLEFRSELRIDTPTLELTLQKGCGPVALSERAVEVALGSCPQPLDLTRAIGLALGLPNLHQRADRDRYLVLTDESRFSCEAGEFYGICPAIAGVPARLGAFNPAAAMFARPSGCALDSETPLYLPRGTFPDAASACAALGSGRPPFRQPDANAIAELYAMKAGWRPFEPVGVDRGPEQPIASHVDETIYLRTGLALAAGDDGRLTAFAIGESPTRRAIWSIEYTGAAWGAWTDLIATPDRTDPAELAIAGVTVEPEAAARISAPNLVDLVLHDASAVFHTTYDRVSGRAAGFTNLGSPVASSTVSAVSVAAGESDSAFVYAHASADRSANGRVYVLELEAARSSEWAPLPELNFSTPVTAIAAMGTADGRQHVIAGSQSGIEYGNRTPGGEWSEWVVLVQEPADSSASLADLSLLGDPANLLGFVAVRTEQQFPYLWHSACVEEDCRSRGAWTAPNAIAVTPRASAVASSAHLFHIVAPFEEPDLVTGTSRDGMWHKSWRAPR